MSYFRTYLTEHLKYDFFEQCGKDDSTHMSIIFDDELIDSTSHNINDSITKFAKKVLDYIENQVKTVLVLGGYDKNIEGNEAYPGIRNFLYQTNISLNKEDVNEVYSTSNIKNEVVKMIKGTPLFKEYLTYDSLVSVISKPETKLFNVSDEYLGFLGLSGCRMPYDAYSINVSWNDLSKWLFDQSRQTPNNLLKNLIRTQIYRPLFFKYDNYSDFTSDSNYYWCKVQKSFVDHDGNKKTLVFSKYPSVNWELSGIDIMHCINQQYKSNNNTVSYDVVSD